MVLSFLMNLENCRNTIQGFEWMHRNPIPILQSSRLVYIGLRDLDAPEKATVKQLGIKAFTMHDVDKYGIAKVMEMALDHVLGRLPRPLHLSLDIGERRNTETHTFQSLTHTHTSCQSIQDKTRTRILFIILSHSHVSSCFVC
jgi:hypothetical protein